jgi:hypothetical protein
MTTSSSVRITPGVALLYAAGDIGTACLAFYWLYFLIEVAGLPILEAGLIHASGYAVSAGANLWARRGARPPVSLFAATLRRCGGIRAAPGHRLRSDVSRRRRPGAQLGI